MVSKYTAKRIFHRRHYSINYRKVTIWKISISNDGGRSTWYPQACKFLKLRHHTHSYYYEKKYHYRERTIQYIKDRTEMFDDYFHVKKITVH